MSTKSIWAVCLALILTLSASSGVLAQCGGGGGGSGYMQDHHGGSSGHMGSGQMGMHGSQAPAQPDTYTSPGYATSNPPASGYGQPQNTGRSGRMMGQGGGSSDHSGHTGN